MSSDRREYIAEAVATRLLGQPDKESCPPTDVRFRDNGSVITVNYQTGAWDFEGKPVGGILDLIRHFAGISIPDEQVAFLKECVRNFNNGGGTGDQPEPEPAPAPELNDKSVGQAISQEPVGQSQPNGGEARETAAPTPHPELSPNNGSDEGEPEPPSLLDHASASAIDADVPAEPSLDARTEPPVEVEFTKYKKNNGAISKTLSLNPDGALNKSAVSMAVNEASRVRMPFNGLADFIDGLGSNEALGLAVPRDGLPDKFKVTSKDYAAAGDVTRTLDNFVFVENKPTLVLLDHDTTGMPPAVRAKKESCGGFWKALCTVLPQLASTAHVVRASTSAGLYHSDTGEKIEGSDGQHVYVLARDGSDIKRFLVDFHDRCWLAGFGWHALAKDGSFLDRSVIDKTVGSPERIAFEGAPVLVPPLAQDKESRRPVFVDGASLFDTYAACPPLTADERRTVEALKANSKKALQPEAARIRAEFDKNQIDRHVAHGVPRSDAERIVKKFHTGVLYPGFLLEFNNPKLATKTVLDVLDNPEMFIGEALADPVEGIDYGPQTAKVFKGTDDSRLFIKSFAHGECYYQLRYDAQTITKILEKMEKGSAVAEAFVAMMACADISEIEKDILIDKTTKRSGTGATKKSVKDMLKKAAAGETLDQASTETPINKYIVQDNATYLLTRDSKGYITPLLIANFNGAIVEDVFYDDASDQPEHVLVIETNLGRIEVPSSKFDSMNWVTENFGGDAIISRCCSAIRVRRCP